MHILEIENLTKRYSNHLALSDISIKVPQGHIFGLLGPNGAGKTSLIRIITQITRADEGTILFNNEKLTGKHIASIGYLPEERGLYKKMEVGEQLLFFAQLKGLSKHEAMHLLKDWVERFEIKGWWRKKVEELSKGMQQKIQFIATVLHNPKLLILDEPFSGFDPINAELITNEILNLKKNGCSIIISTHRMESVEQLCDDIALINKSKKVLDGSVKQVRDQFKTHTFSVECNTAHLQLPNEYQILESSVKDNDIFSYKIKKAETDSNNKLIQLLVNQTEIIRFAELIPSMQEIFIRVVNP
ncbi:MAG: ABC transporter ATP-binding protein [Bacteroidia bacterium]|nr:ABC transporter ATP-binding protein [Bacteroidia bacterium]MCC7533606.1 ATP-binding cassette domain-containing protein [Bacteroidia bacterium]MCZ2140448.1 ATP-binding cassette domain-containing protein [Bacteroidia bacterium]